MLACLLAWVTEAGPGPQACWLWKQHNETVPCRLKMEQQWGPGARVVPSLITTKAGCRARETLLSVEESRGQGGAGSAAWRSRVQPRPRTGSQPSTSIRGCELHGAPHKTRQGQRGQGAAATQSTAPEVTESDRHRAAAGRQHPPTAPTHTAPPNCKQSAQRAGARSKPACRRPRICLG